MSADLLCHLCRVRLEPLKEGEWCASCGRRGPRAMNGEAGALGAKLQQAGEALDALAVDRQALITAAVGLRSGGRRAPGAQVLVPRELWEAFCRARVRYLDCLELVRGNLEGQPKAEAEAELFHANPGRGT